MIDWKLFILLAVLCLGCDPASDWRKVSGIDRDIDFYGIWGTSADDIYAVGEATGKGSVILHRDASGWSELPGPEESIGLRDVWVSPAGVLYVVGRGGLFRREGDGWIREVESDLEGIHGAGDDFVVAVGAAEIWEYDGNGWTKDLQAESTLEYQAILMVDVWVESDAFAVAAGGLLQCACQGNHLMHFTGSNWASIPANHEVFLKGIWGTASDNILAVGGDLWEDNGSAILHFDGAAWSLVGQGREDLLSGIWGSGIDDITVVGMNGEIRQFDGSEWSLSPSGTSSNLRDVWGADADTVYAVGSGGVILRRR